MRLKGAASSGGAMSRSNAPAQHAMIRQTGSVTTRWPRPTAAFAEIFDRLSTPKRYSTSNGPGAAIGKTSGIRVEADCFGEIDAWHEFDVTQHLTYRQICLISHPSFIAESFGGEDACGGRGRVERGEERDADGDGGDDDAIENAWSEGQGVDGVDLGGEMDEVIVAAGP